MPRCWYPGFYGPQIDWQPRQVPYYGSPRSMPAYGVGTNPWTMPLTAQMSKEQELDFLKNQAQVIKEQLEQIEARMRDLGTIEEES